MAYRFELREKVGSAFSRIALEQIDRVLSDLKAQEDRSVAVHESRKSLKRVRALLRLVRPGLGDTTFRSENARFREIGVLFSADRDRHVLSGVAAKLGQTMGARYRKAFAGIARTLADPPAADASANATAATKEAISRLTTARKDVTRLRLEPDGFDTLQEGLKASYRRGRRQLREAYTQPSDEAFHDLRKAVQQHWRHMQVLQRAWPELFGARLGAARKLSQILGDDHDLAVLVAYLRTLPRSILSAVDRRAIERHCRDEQRKLRVVAYPLCRQLYAERAGRFAKRITAIWQAAVEAAEIDDAMSRTAKKPKNRTSTTKKPKTTKKRPRRGNSAQAAA